jgi:two-component system, OmpR family, sensor histidine kinase KdpD
MRTGSYRAYTGDVVTLHSSRSTESNTSDTPVIPPAAAPLEFRHETASSSRVREYGLAMSPPILSTALAWVLSPYFLLANLLVVYVVGIVVLAVRVGRGPALVGASLSVLAFDAVFLRHAPAGSALADMQYVVTFAAMVALALFTSDRSQCIRQQARAARQRERCTAVLDAMSRDLAGASSVDEVFTVSVRHLSGLFDSAVAALVPDDTGRLVARFTSLHPSENTSYDTSIGRWVWERSEPAGPGTPNFPEANERYLPLVASRQTVGILVMRPLRTPIDDGPEFQPLAEQFATRIALAAERQILLEEAQQARIRFETERVRNTLLAAVSHDLRTPMAAIKGSATSLIEGHRTLDDATCRELAEAIRDEADRLTRLVSNLLDMTRLESGWTIRREWQSLEEILGVALAALESHLGEREISTDLPADLPLVMADGLLIQQVLVNLVENAVKYTPPGTPIQISAAATDGAVTVTVADRGPGLAPHDLTRVFEKFYRGPGLSAGGLGLGLSICQSIVEAHGGRMWAENRVGGGAMFRFQLPASVPTSNGLSLHADHVG